MKALLISTDNPYTTHQGGKHVHLLLLERGLKKLGIEVVTLYYNQESPIELIRRGVSQFLPEKSRYQIKVRRMMTDLRNRSSQIRFDIVHAHDVLSLLALETKPQRKVLTVHGYFARENIEFVRTEAHRKEIYPLLFELEKKAMKMADYLITVDQRLKSYAVSEFNYPIEKIEVMYNAVDTDCFEPVSREEQRKSKESLKFGARDFIVLVPRRLVEKNGVVYAVRAIRQLKMQDVKMVIAGDGPEREKIVTEAAGDDRIRLVGLVRHTGIVFYYKMADAILIPSITSHGIQEATSLAMLEGMACGKVVICSRVGGMKEIIRNGENGLLVEEKRPEAIARTIERVYENRDMNTDIGKKAREYILQNHSFLAHAKRVAQTYAMVLGEEPVA